LHACRSTLEDPTPIQTYEYDTNYINNYGNLLAVRLVSPRRTYDFRLKNRDTNDILVYRPNLQTGVGIGFTYKWLAFDIVINPKWNKSKTEEKGETKEFNIKGTLYLKRHMIDAALRTYKGMHIANPEVYLSPWDGTYPFRPDLNNSNFYITYTIPFNYKKFSPKTSFQLDGRMKKSAGSVVSTTMLHLSFIKADSSIMPVAFEDAFSPQAHITDMNMVHINQLVGYAYTFIHKKFYLTLSAMPGVSLTLASVQSDAGKYNPNYINFSFNSKSGLGYNSRRWYAGLYMIYNYQSMKLADDLAFNINLGEIRFFVGYRIKAPYIVHSIIDK
jgi:hypothetical protein